MKISDRFTDYILIGGFFWLLQFIVLSFVFFPPLGWNQLLREFGIEPTYILTVFNPYIPFFTALLGALALIVIFTTGLLLDLLGSSYYRGIEVRVFIANLRRNKRWLEQVMNENEDYIQDDWTLLLNAPPVFSKSQIRVFMIWNSRYRREYSETMSKVYGLLKPFTRIQSFLLVNVLLAAGVEKMELLSTQINLWNTSRAIAAATTLVALETVMLVFSSTRVSSDVQYAFLIAQLGLTFFAIAVVRSAYARFCSTLFALAYLVNSRVPDTLAKLP